MKFKANEMEPLLRLIVKAVEKGVGEDIRDYLTSTDKATNNAVRLMRADNINTNLRDSVVSDTIELKYFNRSAWVGCLLIDRQHCLTFTICTKQTLESIPKKPNRHIPHYLQTILYVQNSEVEAQYKQSTLFDGMPEEVNQFSNEEYQRDYENIMDDDLSFGDKYQHWVVVYEASHLSVTSISLMLLDKDFQTAQEIKLDNLLKPDFSELTTTEATSLPKQDAHSLVTVKPKIKKSANGTPQQETRVSAKITEEKKQA